MESFFNLITDAALLTCTFIWAVTSDSLKPLLIIAAIVIHEIGHTVTSFLLGNRFKKLSTQNSGLKLHGNTPYISYKAEAVTALGGPLFNFLSAGACSCFGESGNVFFFTATSFALGILNLLPIKEFDGGRITECALSLFCPYSLVSVICDVLSFLSLFFLWSMAVYLMMRGDGSITLFIFSTSLFAKIFLKRPKR